MNNAKKTIIHDSLFMIQEITYAMREIAKEIKRRMCKEVGEWITVSIGIAPNRYLAKVASDLKKPDGLEVITSENIREVFAALTLTDLCGIKKGISTRLLVAGIGAPLAFLDASPETLARALKSITGYHWWRRIHGYEDGSMYKELDKEVREAQKSFGQSFALGTSHYPKDSQVKQILTQLVFKMGRRMRKDRYMARGIGVSIAFRDWSHWHKQQSIHQPVYADSDMYRILTGMLLHAPQKIVRILAITSYNLIPARYEQRSLLSEEQAKHNIVRALDAIHDRFGDWLVVPGRMLAMEQKVLDRIAFGKC